MGRQPQQVPNDIAQQVIGAVNRALDQQSKAHSQLAAQVARNHHSEKVSRGMQNKAIRELRKEVCGLKRDIAEIHAISEPRRGLRAC